MKPWTKIKLQQLVGDDDHKSRWKCENADCKGRGGNLEAHHGIFSRSKHHKEYDCKENMVMLCHKCNVNRLLDNKEGKLLALQHATERFGKAHMKAWLESLKETHKMHDEINYYLRVLED